MSTNGSGSVYQMNNALEGYMLGDSFSGISDDGSFWDYIQQTLVPAVFPDNSSAPDGYLLNYNRMIGTYPVLNISTILTFFSIFIKEQFGSDSFESNPIVVPFVTFTSLNQILVIRLPLAP